MSAALALADAIGTRLAGSPAVTALVPADNIVADRWRPEAFPSIIVGDDQEVDADDVIGSNRRFTVHSTLHVWDRTPGFSTAKRIAHAIREAMLTAPVELDGARCIRLRFAGSRFLTDPDGQTTHGIVSLETDVELPA